MAEQPDAAPKTPATDDPRTKAARVKPFDGPSADEATGPVPPGVDEELPQTPR